MHCLSIFVSKTLRKKSPAEDKAISTEDIVTFRERWNDNLEITGSNPTKVSFSTVENVQKPFVTKLTAFGLFHNSFNEINEFIEVDSKWKVLP